MHAITLVTVYVPTCMMLHLQGEQFQVTVIITMEHETR